MNSWKNLEGRDQIFPNLNINTTQLYNSRTESCEYKIDYKILWLIIAMENHQWKKS